MSSRLRLLLTRVVLVAFSLSMGLLIAEGIVRVVTPQSLGVPMLDEVDGISSQRPNVRGRIAVPKTFDTTVSTNSQRFRGRKEYATEPDSGVVRIATLGDSCTFGIGANDDEAYPFQLERILQESINGKHSEAIEVVNAGVPGTGTGDQCLWYDTWVKRFRPQVVVLTVNFNDVGDDSARGLFTLDQNGKGSPRPLDALKAADSRVRSVRAVADHFPGYSFLCQNSHLLALLRNTGSQIAARKRQAVFAREAEPAGSKVGEEISNDRGLRLITAEIEWLNKRVQETGARLAVVFLPGWESVYTSSALGNDESRRQTEAIAKTVKDTCSSNSIPFSDMTGALHEAAESTDRPLYYKGGDTHPTPEGYRRIANAVADLLVEERMLGHSS